MRQFMMTSIVKLVPCFNIDVLSIWRKQIKQKRKHVTFCRPLQVYWLNSAFEGEVWERLQPRD